MQPAGDLVAAAAELAAGVQRAQNDLDRGLSDPRDGIDGDPGAVVGDRSAAVLVQDDLDLGAAAGQGLVDGVVHNLIEEVMKTIGPGAPDVHRGALPNTFQPLEDLDLLSGVRGRLVGRHVGFLGHARVFG